MKHELPKLPYSFDALEPHIDAGTMEVHYTKHHQGYTDKLNTALEEKPAEISDQSIVDILSDAKLMEAEPAIRNNGGGYHNHLLFWENMSPTSNDPSGELTRKIEEAFGDMEKFKQQFTDISTTHFGSGWAWLTVKNNKLNITTTINQDSPLTIGETSLLALDLWEHAYYLKYQNRRPEYIDAWWNVVNWEIVATRLKAAT